VTSCTVYSLMTICAETASQTGFSFTLQQRQQFRTGSCLFPVRSAEGASVYMKFSFVHAAHLQDAIITILVETDNTVYCEIIYVLVRYESKLSTTVNFLIRSVTNN
jgi:hypothetical protein